MNRIRNLMQAFGVNGNERPLLDELGNVSAIPVGWVGDGLAPRSGTPIDKAWSDLVQEMNDARQAWRQNPLARRIIGLTTSYAVGAGITLQSSNAQLQAFIEAFWMHNGLAHAVDEWSDELSRSGELFPVFFTDEMTGMSTLRVVPACLIDAVDYDSDDYRSELRYRETQPVGAPEKWWTAAKTRSGGLSVHIHEPVMVHFAVNRPVGAVRGESDLAPILPWLRRYNRWLEDRVRLNAAVRSFLWIVHAPARLRGDLQERYRRPPDPGSVIIAEQGAEEWTAVTPNLRAADAEKDGRAIRWMIVAGGPGTALLDIGEGEDSNLATGRAMAEQRRRFLRRRQAYLAHMLTELTLTAWNRYAAVRGLQTPTVTEMDIVAITPDISPEDNVDLATAAVHLTGALTELAEITAPGGHPGPAYRKVALRLFAKFAGEQLSDAEISAILEEGEAAGEPHGSR